MRKQIPSTPWRHNRVFEDVGVAIQSNRTPTEFWSLDHTDQAYMIAYFRTISTIESYKAEKEKERARRQRKVK
jgi:hypothetical protein